MVKASSNQDLKTAFQSHLEETKGHVERQEKIFQMLELVMNFIPVVNFRAAVVLSSRSMEGWGSRIRPGIRAM